MSEKIATEAYAKNKGGGSAAAVPDKCCTKSRAEAFGCTVASGYGSLQLVPESALSGSTPTKSLLKFFVTDRGKGTLLVGDDLISAETDNWHKLSSVSISGVRNTYPQGELWNKDITNIDLGEFVAFSSQAPIIYTAYVDGVQTSVSLQSGYQLENLQSLRDNADRDIDPMLSYDDIRCNVTLDPQYASTYATAVGHSDN